MLFCPVILAITLKEGSTAPTWVQMKETKLTTMKQLP